MIKYKSKNIFILLNTLCLVYVHVYYNNQLLELSSNKIYNKNRLLYLTVQLKKYFIEKKNEIY